MRVNPEIYIVEGAESLAWARRQYPLLNQLRQRGLPGARAHIEFPGERTEQERPTGNHRDEVGAGAQGKTGASW